MKRRDFSKRDRERVEKLIREICRMVGLDDRDSECLNIGWTGFLEVYQCQPDGFHGNGRRGWCAAAKVIYEKLAREKAALDFARYGQVSLNAPVSAQVPIPRMELLHFRCGDFQNGVCLRDYVGRLPVDAKFMARRFMDGDTMDEIRDLNHWGARRTVRALRVLEAAMRRYCQI